MEQVQDNAEATVDPSRASKNQSSRSVQAQRLMQKLQDSDESLALLLTQAADSIESLLNQSDGITANSQDAALDLVPFEDLSQDWLANIYDTQLTLRKAIRFLVRSDHAPTLTAANAFVHGGGVSAATAGSAARVVTSQPISSSASESNGEKQTDTQKGKDDALLSMSALRLKRQVWKETLQALQQIEADRHKASNVNVDAGS